jgi:hypothetical protein
MKTLTLSFLLISTTVASCQMHWEKATNWTLYRYQGHRLFKIPLDSLKFYNSLPLNQDSIGIFVNSLGILHPEAPIEWMGGYIATCQINGALRKVELSNYGGFIFDEKSKTYYQLPPDKTERWISYLQ